MKSWTVMLIPQQGNGNTRTLSLHSIQLWSILGLISVLAFTSTFMLQQFRAARVKTANLEQEAFALQRALEASRTVPGTQGVESLAPEEKAEIEARVRQEYDARDAAIVAELSDIYDVEAQVRQLQGLPPRVTTATGLANDAAETGPEPANGKGGGKGGPPGSDRALGEMVEQAVIRPPHVIYGLSEPSADLIIQEIRLRKASLLDLTGDLVAIQDRVAHTPSIWPTANSRRRISSGFGYRRDPLGRSVRHHDGTDVSAPYGASIVATADGKVLESAWDGYLGNVVRIDHGYGIVTTYGHMSKRSVEAGKTISRGDEIGKVGSTGRSTGPHIHYEIHVNGKLVDPQQYFGK